VGEWMSFGRSGRGGKKLEVGGEGGGVGGGKRVDLGEGKSEVRRKSAELGIGRAVA